MKGPFERLKYDLRRTWECPACHRRDRSSFTTTYLFCTCKPPEGRGPLSMHLVEDGIRRVWGALPPPREPMPFTPAVEENTAAIATLPALESISEAVSEPISENSPVPEAPIQPAEDESAVDPPALPGE